MLNLLRNPFKDSKFFKDWKYGFVEGLIMAFAISLIYASYLVLLNLVFLIVAATFSFLAWQGTEQKTPQTKLTEVKERTYSPCPECGNKTKHKPTCTLGRKKKE